MKAERLGIVSKKDEHSLKQERAMHVVYAPGDWEKLGERGQATLYAIRKVIGKKPRVVVKKGEGLPKLWGTQYSFVAVIPLYGPAHELPGWFGEAIPQAIVIIDPEHPTEGLKRLEGKLHSGTASGRDLAVSSGPVA
ncbi:MAG: hypothetical protein HYV77_02385 [Candidatus Wildermuthbacteria bacterium]|nr:hypothetical protein [Candidatus Wildermuthbacteria bacterium]